MNSELYLNKLKWLAAVLAIAAIVTVPSLAADVTKELAAVPATVTLPGPVSVPMWGFIEVASAATYTCPGTPVPWQVVNLGSLNAGDNLTVNVKNCLPKPVSVFIPGQFKPLAPVWASDAAGNGPSNTRTSPSQRVRSLDAETTPNGGLGTYQWTALKGGTYLFHSATYQQFQVQMGLYGTVVVGTYPEAANEALLVYSEIDPVVHNSIGTWVPGQSAIDYKPTYFLVNGKTFPETAPVPVSVNTPVLLRFVNAGLQTHVPTLVGGLYMKQLAEDGNRYPVPREEYSVELPALKTVDAVLTVPNEGQYALFDRMLRPGMTTYIQAGAPVELVAVADSTTTSEDTVLPGTSVLANDTYTGTGTLSASLVSTTSNGSLALLSDGTFTYTPNGNFNGTDSFTYFATDGTLSSNATTVTISVTPTPDAPVAVDDPVTVTAGTSTTFSVLANDTDADGDALTVASFTYAGTGTLVKNPDETFTYTPAAGTTTDSFTYQAQDPALTLSNPATVTITVTAPPTPQNQPPVAVDDIAQTKANTGVVILVVGNDTDSDGTVVASTVAITLNPTHGGTVVNNGDGTVTYTPKKNFRGTDVFKYTVQDNQGAVSNEATVKVNVVK
ncbi:MAG: Ig-like domain-containing protein [Acidobacteriota bacterium]